jgi:hypothetical protein
LPVTITLNPQSTLPSTAALPGAAVKPRPPVAPWPMGATKPPFPSKPTVVITERPQDQTKPGIRPIYVTKPPLHRPAFEQARPRENQVLSTSLHRGGQAGIMTPITAHPSPFPPQQSHNRPTPGPQACPTSQVDETTWTHPPKGC